MQILINQYNSRGENTCNKITNNSVIHVHANNSLKAIYKIIMHLFRSDQRPHGLCHDRCRTVRTQMSRFRIPLATWPSIYFYCVSECVTYVQWLQWTHIPTRQSYKPPNPVQHCTCLACFNIVISASYPNRVPEQFVWFSEYYGHRLNPCKALTGWTS